MRGFLLGIVCLIGILVGCTDQSDTDQANEINKLKKQLEQLSLEKDNLEEEKNTLELAMSEEANRDYSMILAKDIEKYPYALYKTASIDIDEDGEDEIIELHVDAGKMENGRYGWDDGQKWLLVVKDGDKTYPLFDEYVQLGYIEFSTTFYERKPLIVMINAQHSDRTVQSFKFDKDEQGYLKETFYKKENTNNHYNETASHAFFQEAFQFIDMAFTTNASFIQESEKNLQDDEKRWLTIGPMLENISNAERLLKMATDLNPELNVSLANLINLLYQIDNKPPTSEQMNQLKSIQAVFKEIDTANLILKEENQIHPDIVEKVHKVELILKNHTETNS
ncbi:hypothetical protein [Psychrobacillus sp. BL-248-WT-3]|uniref:hypothetical protein n=1 Tax=Psychrobacillus sp. BL-248-WT-3 TaxID=2725306 RepID=UPI00146CD66F|nr:hypothetical protein [Psychrobacillus sp. BL-248-WT-3]NME05914.1 hypothetical protein [Psychrobacillus sp. BL-248-WT-3]